MTRLFNDPASFTEDMLDGFLDANARYVVGVPGGVVRADQDATRQGRGRGRRRIRSLPRVLRCGRTGFADGAVVGNIFTSPSATEAASVARAAHGDAGVLLITGNYAGDVMNFGLAPGNCARGYRRPLSCSDRRHRKRRTRRRGETARNRRRFHRVPVRQRGGRGRAPPRRCRTRGPTSQRRHPHPRGRIRRLHHARGGPAIVHGDARHNGPGTGHPR